MRQLKSSLQSLREIFESAISAKYLAEPIAVFDRSRTCAEVRSFMEEREFDVIGISEDRVTKYKAYLVDLAEGAVGSYATLISPKDCANEDDSILMALEIIKRNEHVFLRDDNHIFGIITKGDLQKHPMRMYAFGIISLLEMQMLRAVRILYPDDAWVNLLSDKRHSKAKQYREDRKLQNEQIDLVDCLQFKDKVTILVKNGLLCRAIDRSKNKTEDLLDEAEGLRNLLAHSQDILSSKGAATLIELLQELERVIEALESFEPQVQ